jgi:MFS superfamily sulfate permease-like transporter
MGSTDFGRRYFSRPPHKSLYFWLYTIWLLGLAIWALLIGARYYSRLSPSALEMLCLSVIAAAILWIRAWQSHTKLYEMNLLSRSSNLEDQTRFDVVLMEAAYLANTGLGIALFLLMTALMGFVKILAKPTGGDLTSILLSVAARHCKLSVLLLHTN